MNRRAMSSVSFLAMVLLAVGGLGCGTAEAQSPSPAASPPAAAEGKPAVVAVPEPPAPPVPPSAAPTAEPVAPAVAESEVDRVLKLAEKAGETTLLFKADFEYHMNETLIEENEWRTGRMAYRKPSEVAIEYTDRAQNESFRFDGRVFIEDRPKQKQRYIHILRKPQDPMVNILDVEQMPFPQPFGGKREMLLQNYTVTHQGTEVLGNWTRPKMSPAEAKPPETKFEHLELIPKPGSDAAKNYTKVEFWIDPADGLVRQVRSEDKTERIMTMRFKNVKINEQVGKVDDKTFEIGKLPSGWEEPTVMDHTREEVPQPMPKP